MQISRTRISVFSTSCHRGVVFVTLLVQKITLSSPILSLLFVFFIFTKQLKATPSHIHLSFLFSTSALLLRHETQTGNTTEVREDVYIGKKIMGKGKEGKVKLFYTPTPDKTKDVVV